MRHQKAFAGYGKLTTMNADKKSMDVHRLKETGKTARFRITKDIFLILIVFIFGISGDAFVRRVKGDADSPLIREDKGRLIADIEPQGWFIERIRNKAEDIPRLIELPLREAIEILYDKNILTTRCSANRNDIKYGFAYIEGDLETLSEENRAILDRMAEEGTAEIEGIYFAIKLQVDSSTTVVEVSERFIALANRFLLQQPIWIEKERYTREGFKGQFSIVDDRKVIPTVERPGYYYDAKTGFIYYSEEHYGKIQGYYSAK